VCSELEGVSDYDCLDPTDAVVPWVGECVRPGRGLGCVSACLGSSSLPGGPGANSPVVDSDADPSPVWGWPVAEKTYPKDGYLY
jgi:hypothetical protein